MIALDEAGMPLLAEPAGGFFDLPVRQHCANPEHEPPGLLHIPAGKGYRHVCPGCGAVRIITSPATL